jgi:hypothetical protein
LHSSRIRATLTFTSVKAIKTTASHFSDPLSLLDKIERPEDFSMRAPDSTPAWANKKGHKKTSLNGIPLTKGKSVLLPKVVQFAGLVLRTGLGVRS